jgi:DNA-directed RNA polymerase specialized sigma24 family protein
LSSQPKYLPPLLLALTGRVPTVSEVANDVGGVLLHLDPVSSERQRRRDMAWDAIENISPEDKAQIWVWALKRSGRNPIDAEDLMQQTYTELLAGTFRWKEGVPFRAQAYWVMRRIKSKQLQKGDTHRLTLYAEAGQIEWEAGRDTPESLLAVKRADEVYDAVMFLLPADSFSRRLWEAMYMSEVYSIKEQVEVLGPPETRIYTARKAIKKVCREVFGKFGFKFRNKTKGE